VGIFVYAHPNQFGGHMQTITTPPVHPLDTPMRIIVRIIVTIIVIVALLLGLVFALRYRGERRAEEQQTVWPTLAPLVAPMPTVQPTPAVPPSETITILTGMAEVPELHLTVERSGDAWIITDEDGDKGLCPNKPSTFADLDTCEHIGE
jgi:hypothetical protein